MGSFLFIGCQGSDDNSENGTTNQNPVSEWSKLHTSGNSNIIKYIEHNTEYDGIDGYRTSWEIIYDDDNRIKEIKEQKQKTYKDASSHTRYESTSFEYLNGNKVQCTVKIVDGSINNEKTSFYSLNSDGYIVSGSTAGYEYKYENGYLKRAGSSSVYIEYNYSNNNLISEIQFEPNNKSSYPKMKSYVLWEGAYSTINNNMNIDINSFIHGNTLMAAGLLGKRSTHLILWGSKPYISNVRQGIAHQLDSQGRPSVLSYDPIYNKNAIRIYYK